ncbi:MULTISPECIES: hypothetical protein [unclassified Rhizobium]|uniref:hypothetical protein n=1 Tax=unclassified Rhizobium TaxID=2613769 RepID=UPI002180C913|nr:MULTISPECIES: hypothetical protein [unclassified Rhizobium]
MASRATHAGTALIVCFIRGQAFLPTLACLLTAPGEISCVLESLPGGSTRQQIKLFVVERKPSRKPNPTLQDRRSGEGWMLTLHKVSKINGMGAHDADHAAATGGDDRA